MALLFTIEISSFRLIAFYITFSVFKVYLINKTESVLRSDNTRDDAKK